MLGWEPEVGQTPLALSFPQVSESWEISVRAKVPYVLPQSGLDSWPALNFPDLSLGHVPGACASNKT